MKEHKKKLEDLLELLSVLDSCSCSVCEYSLNRDHVNTERNSSSLGFVTTSSGRGFFFPGSPE